jgi:hypothetical protein
LLDRMSVSRGVGGVGDLPSAVEGPGADEHVAALRIQQVFLPAFIWKYFFLLLLLLLLLLLRLRVLGAH